ncbi:hypothetical protein [Gemmobacter nectariphilus]|uniref:hypothetical protein n=1 Tax=Gemmobacter nectariphilus TaxID=220343 RepID=UPI000552921E|nr:hypothetical protein [Gemmobacter nectariphilus]
MCRRIVHGIHGVGLIALLAFALVATGFAHRVPSASDIAVEAYVLAGGDISDICGDMGSDGKTTHRDCPACHIVGSTMLPDAPQSLADVNYVFVATVIAPRESRAIRTVLDPARGMRAPPLA